MDVCLEYLRQPIALKEEGLFRVPGDSSSIKNMHSQFLGGTTNPSQLRYGLRVGKGRGERGEGEGKGRGEGERGRGEGEERGEGERGEGRGRGERGRGERRRKGVWRLG